MRPVFLTVLLGLVGPSNFQDGGPEEVSVVQDDLRVTSFQLAFVDLLDHEWDFFGDFPTVLDQFASNVSVDRQEEQLPAMEHENVRLSEEPFFGECFSDMAVSDAELVATFFRYRTLNITEGHGFSRGHDDDFPWKDPS